MSKNNEYRLFEAAVRRGLWLQRPSEKQRRYVVSDINGQQVASSKSEVAAILIAAAKVANGQKTHNMGL